MISTAISTLEHKNNSMELYVLESRSELGRRAAADIAEAIRADLLTKDSLRILFAAAPSQSEMLEALVREPGIDWTRISAFHMDEYIGLSPDAPQRFGTWLQRSIFDRVPLGSYHLIQPGEDPEAACREYANKLESPIDFVLLGIGTNGHLAFNDPPADLADPLPVKVVELDAVCRQQQVDDKCFSTLEEVPHRAISLTVPTLLRGQRLFCCVPGLHKSEAVRAMVESPISGDCPATALRMHPHCKVYLDRDSSSKLSR